MTQYAFQKEVLTALQELKKSVGKIEMTYKTEVLVRLQELKNFVEEQKKFNEEQKNFNDEIEGFVKEQKETNKRLEMTYDGLTFLVQNEVITRLDGIADEIKLYTDKKILTHEEKYKHALAA
ncbi:hypothetical protein HZA38_00540 [Candidatus Peregrinibacteria bacterium]|nr:hypothetical protein [Candidatus Peregrinibacteria bacterium]